MVNGKAKLIRKTPWKVGGWMLNYETIWRSLSLPMSLHRSTKQQGRFSLVRRGQLNPKGPLAKGSSNLVKTGSIHCPQNGLRLQLQCRVLVCPVQCLGSILNTINQSITFPVEGKSLSPKENLGKGPGSWEGPDLALVSTVKDSSTLLLVWGCENSIVFGLLDFKTSHK